MEFDFETLVYRRQSNLKKSFQAPEVAAAGNISFDGAEPDYKTAPVITEAVKRFAENGLFGFTLCTDEYRNAVVWWMKESRKTNIRPEWIVPTLGTIYSLATTLRMCTKEGDGMIVVTPVYNRYRQAAERLGRKTVECPLRENNGRYELDFAAVEEAMKIPENKLFVLCNPHNPIGQIWRKSELEKLAELADKYEITVFSDEIFADNCYSGNSCPCYLDIKGAEKHAIVSTSLGKSFGFTGVNHANMLIADSVLRERFTDRRTRDHYGSIDPMIYECVLAAYSPDGKRWLDASNEYVEKNITLIKHFFAENLPKAVVYGGEGGYLLWIDWRAYYSDEKVLMDFLVKKAFIDMGAGSEYGNPGFTRMCTASPRWCIEKALEDLKKALAAEHR